MENHRSCCIRNVVGDFYCPKCSTKLIKYGFSQNSKQRFKCPICKTTSVSEYSYNAYNKDTDKNITALLCEGVGIRGITRLLKIALNTVLGRIKKIASEIKQPIIKTNQTFEVDERCTFVKHKENKIWVVAAYCQETKSVVAFNVGKRTNKTLNSVIQTIQNSHPKKIITDKLKNYKYLINRTHHSTKFRGINHIERMNLTLRTHLKRLNRRTIAFSRSVVILSAVLKIYFWR